MLKLKELKEGDYVMAAFEGQQVEGMVKELHRDDDNQICVETPVQEFWFNREDLDGIPLNEAQLLQLGFQKEEREDGSVKYLNGPFRVLIPAGGNFANFEMWYREDHRHITSALFLHEFQHHYSQMTKVNLVKEKSNV